MQVERSEAGNVPWGTLLLCLVFIGCMIVALPTLSWMQFSAPGPTSATDPLIGAWTLSDPQGPGTSRLLTFASDGSSESKDISESTGVVLQRLSGTWHRDGQTLVIREHRKGLSSIFDYVPGVGPVETSSRPIVAVSEDELLLGDKENPIRYERVAVEPSERED